MVQLQKIHERSRRLPLAYAYAYASLRLEGRIPKFAYREHIHVASERHFNLNIG